MGQLQALFHQNSKVPSLLNPATHTFKMSQWADKATVGEGDMGTNVVWMYPQVSGRKNVGLVSRSPQPFAACFMRCAARPSPAADAEVCLMLCRQLWQPHREHDSEGHILADGIGKNHYNKYNTHMGMPGH